MVQLTPHLLLAQQQMQMLQAAQGLAALPPAQLAGITAQPAATVAALQQQQQLSIAQQAWQQALGHGQTQGLAAAAANYANAPTAAAAAHQAANVAASVSALFGGLASPYAVAQCMQPPPAPATTPAPAQPGLANNGTATALMAAQPGLANNILAMGTASALPAATAAAFTVPGPNNGGAGGSGDAAGGPTTSTLPAGTGNVVWVMPGGQIACAGGVDAAPMVQLMQPFQGLAAAGLTADVGAHSMLMQAGNGAHMWHAAAPPASR
jgi:hypothetical protein